MKKLLVMLLVMVLVLVGCGNSANKEEATVTETTPTTETTSGGDNTAVETGDTSVETETTEGAVPVEEIDYKTGLDANGYFENVVATDYVELFDYESVEIPADVHTIDDATVDAEIQYVLQYFSSTENVTDRAVLDGDTLNIDYVGSVDGVEFEGGSTGGAGTDVTIGVTAYIDDFLEQLIGHTPGENFDIEVTFPEEYGKEELNGKDAVFNITINYIVETVEPELTDAFVSENLAAMYEWSTVDDMKEGIRADIRDMMIREYIQSSVLDVTPVSEVPETVMAYQKLSMKNYYIANAMQYGMSLEEFLPAYAGAVDIDEVFANNAEDLEGIARYIMVLQAIALDADIQMTDEVISGYFLDLNGDGDYSTYEEQYGIEYLKYTVMQDVVLKYIIDNATLL